MDMRVFRHEEMSWVICVDGRITFGDGFVNIYFKREFHVTWVTSQFKSTHSSATSKHY